MSNVRTKRYAFWSQDYVNRGHRTQIWSTPVGGEVEACFVLTSDQAPNTWPDIRYLGEVVAWVRHGRSSSPPIST